VHLDIALIDDVTFDEEFIHILSLISLQLQNLTQLGINQNRTVRRVCPLQSLQNLLEIQINGQPLYSRQALPSITLLNTDVHIVAALRAILRQNGLTITLIEGIGSLEDDIAECTHDGCWMNAR